MTVVQELAGRIVARANYARANNSEWFERHAEAIKAIERDMLPSGAGIDNGTSVDLDGSRPNRIVLRTAFHHMNDVGMYVTWTDHAIVVEPDLVSGFTVRVTGRDRNDVKAYLADVFAEALAAEYRA